MIPKADQKEPHRGSWVVLQVTVDNDGRTDGYWCRMGVERNKGKVELTR